MQGYMSRAVTAAHRFARRFDHADLLDDIIDHWDAKTHLHERREFVERLQRVAKLREARISFASGDVHCCGVGRLYSWPKVCAARSGLRTLSLSVLRLHLPSSPRAVASLSSSLSSFQRLCVSTKLCTRGGVGASTRQLLPEKLLPASWLAALNSLRRSTLASDAHCPPLSSCEERASTACLNGRIEQASQDFADIAGGADL
jgi:hypothetical protein